MTKKSDLASAAFSSNAFWYLIGGIMIIGGGWYLAGRLKNAVVGGVGDAADIVVDNAGAIISSAVTSPISVGIALGRKVEEFIGPSSESGHTSTQYSLIRDLPLFPEWYGMYWESVTNRWMLRDKSEAGIIKTLEMLDVVGYIATITADGHVTAIRAR
jgi:hypothetical protein